MTVVELMATVSVLGVVLAALFGILDSLTANAERQEAIVRAQEQTRLALAQLERDLRSADPLGTLPSPADYSTRIEAWTWPPSGETRQYVRWEVVDGTLVRSILPGPGDPPSSSATMLSGIVANADGAPAFRYFDVRGDEIAASRLPGDFPRCTERVAVRVTVETQPGPTRFSQGAGVHLRNRQGAGRGC